MENYNVLEEIENLMEKGYSEEDAGFVAMLGNYDIPLEDIFEEQGKRKYMKVWYIWGLYLPVLLIEADSFDKALEKAKRINPNYNTGQLRENMHS